MYGIGAQQLPSDFLEQLSHSLTTGPKPHHMIMSAAIREIGCDSELTVDLMQMQDPWDHPECLGFRVWVYLTYM